MLKSTRANWLVFEILRDRQSVEGRRMAIGPAKGKPSTVQASLKRGVVANPHHAHMRPPVGLSQRCSQTGGFEVKSRYVVVFYRTSGNFAGHAPDVPGCFSMGDTLDEMRANMTEALKFHFEGTADQGLAIPEPTTTTIDFSPKGDNYAPDVLYAVVEWVEVEVPAGSKQPTFAAAD
ncbi:MAG TPA: type II toxin-antitoxin system HicB family antitoxin [Acidisarcina sp.]